MKRYAPILAILSLLLFPIQPTLLAREDAEPPFKQEPGPAKFTVLDRVWHDGARDRDVPVRVYLPEGKGNCPVTVFSHGLGGSREGYVFLGESWASHGYVSVHLQHPGSDDGLWKGADEGERRRAMISGASAENARLRVGDMTFALDQLERLNRDEGALSGRLDLDRIGAAGHSFGALTVELATGAGRRLIPTDPRIKAVIPMSSPVPPLVKGYGGIQIPALHMTGTEDVSMHTTAEARLIPFQQATFSPTYLVNFKGGTHSIFGGRDVTGRAAKDKYSKYILQATNAFWDAHLKGAPAAREWWSSGAAARDLGAIAHVETK